jgi:hypothetical protein
LGLYVLPVNDFIQPIDLVPESEFWNSLLIKCLPELIVDPTKLSILLLEIEQSLAPLIQVEKLSFNLLMSVRALAHRHE